MGLLKRIKDWLSGEVAERADCGHPQEAMPFTIIVQGYQVTLSRARLCRPCSQAYLEKYATFCASCRKMIFPCTHVGRAPPDAPYPYTHLTSECCRSGDLYCGRWGLGELTTIEELEAQGIARPRRKWRLPSGDE